MSTSTGPDRAHTSSTTSGADSEKPDAPADTASTETALKAAKAPVGSGPAPPFGQIVALLLLAVGVLGVQEALARTGVVSTSWTSWLLTRLDHHDATFSMLVLFVVVVVVGLLLLLIVFRPRPRKALTLHARTGVFLRIQDLARLAQARVDGADGVTDTDAVATRTRLLVRVSTVEPAEGNQELEDNVRARLDPTLKALQAAPRLQIAVTNRELT